MPLRVPPCFLKTFQNGRSIYFFKSISDMKLITKQLEKRFLKIGNQSESKDPIVIAKFFNPCGSGTWYATEFDSQTEIAFGYVTGLGHKEWGYFSIAELKTVKCPPFGLPIERDQWFDEQKFSKVNLN